MVKTALSTLKIPLLIQFDLIEAKIVFFMRLFLKIYEMILELEIRNPNPDLKPSI